MKNLKVYVKNFTDAEWQDVTKATLASKMTLRKGFSSLGKGSDVGKMSITFKADDLAAAAVFHTTAKQIRLVKAGRNIFEGYTEGSAKVRSTASSSLAWIQLSAYPYARLAESGKVAEDRTFFDHKILDPADPAHSLVHKLVDLVWSTVPEKYRSILPTLPEQKIITNLSITKVLPLMVIEADDKPLDILDDLLAEYGIARYMENLQMVLLEPYAIDSRVPYALEYNDILSEPSIKSAPFVVPKRCVVNLGKVVEKGPETVYMLDDDDGAEGWAEEFIPHGGVWPKDQDVMEASYGTASETEDLKLFYSSGLSYELKTTEGADIRAEKANLQGTRAEFKFKNYGSADAYIWQVKVNAERTFYRDYSYVTQDEELKAEETEDIDSIYMVDADDAAHYIRTYRAEKKAESQRISISSGKIIFSPGDLITLGNIPYTILVRYVEDNILTGQMKAECVVYDVREIATSGKVQSGSAIGGGISYITLALSGSAYRYKSDGTLSDFSEASIIATVKRYGTMETPHWYVNGLEVVGASGTSLDVPPSYMEGRSYVTVEVTVGRYRASGYIYRINDGTTPIVQYRYSDGNTVPPLTPTAPAHGVWFYKGKPLFINGKIMGELEGDDWKPNPAEKPGMPYKWMRTSTDDGETWVYSCITGKDGEPGKDGAPAQNFSIMAEQTTYPLSSRGVMLEAAERRIFIDRQNLPQTEVCTWTVTPSDLQPEVNVGDSIVITIPKGSKLTSITVQASILSIGIRTLILSGVRAGDPHAEYWGDKFTLEQLQAMKTTPDGEPWANGDNAVVVVKTVDPETQTTKSDPIPYVYNEATKQWLPLQGSEANYSQIMGNALGDILKNPDTQITNAAVYGFFKNLAVLRAFIETLSSQKIELLKDGVIQSKDFETSKIGFQLLANGTATINSGFFHDITIGADSTFKGEIQNDCLSVNLGSMYDDFILDIAVDKIGYDMGSVVSHYKIPSGSSAYGDFYWRGDHYVEIFHPYDGAHVASFDLIRADGSYKTIDVNDMRIIYNSITEPFMDGSSNISLQVAEFYGVRSITKSTGSIIYPLRLNEKEILSDSVIRFTRINSYAPVEIHVKTLQVNANGSFIVNDGQITLNTGGEYYTWFWEYSIDDIHAKIQKSKGCYVKNLSIEDIPTTHPTQTGIVWSDNGTLKIS